MVTHMVEEAAHLTTGCKRGRVKDNLTVFKIGSCNGLYLVVPPKPHADMVWWAFQRWLLLEFVISSLSSAGTGDVSATLALGQIAYMQYKG